MPDYEYVPGVDDWMSLTERRELEKAIAISNAQAPGPHNSPDTCERCGGQGCPGGCPCDCSDCNPRRF